MTNLAPVTTPVLQLRILKLRRRSDVALRRLKSIQTLRLWSVGIFLLLLGIGSSKPQWRVELIAVPLFAVVFPIQVSITRARRRFYRSLQALGLFFERQTLRRQGRPNEASAARGVVSLARQASPTRSDVVNTQTSGSSNAEPRDASEIRELSLIRDLGVMGPHSLLGLIDETFTEHGRQDLIHWMNPQPRPLASIRQRQEQVRSLHRETWFFTRLALVAEMAKAENPELTRIKSEELKTFIQVPFLDAQFQKRGVATLLVWCAMVVMVGAWLTGLGPSPLLLMIAFAAINFWALGKTGQTFKKGVGLDLHLNVLEPVFTLIEKRVQTDARLAALFPVTQKEGPARESRRLSLILIVLGVETNPLLALVVNLFVPWSMTGNFFLERQRVRLAESLPLSLNELAQFEGLGSLLVLQRYQTAVYPELVSEATLQIEGVYHPLINRESVVANDFTFQSGKRCGLLTGSNMAGKSTFLRTVGLNQILAQMGAPVFATRYLTSPFKIESCIEVSDSLRDGFSYFYAEVRRLRELLMSAESPQPVLYLIDEIFRGTNNRERHVGSKSVIQHLARQSHAVGFVSTHDLDLVALENPRNAIENLHFREDFEDGKMVFYYKLQIGPCPSSNALKIMQAEGIHIDPED